MAKIYIDPLDLEWLYYYDKLSLSEIGKIYNCDRATISNRMKEYGIPRRSVSDSLKGREIPWKDKIGDTLKGRKYPGRGGNPKGCKAWNKGISKLKNPDLVTYGVPGEKHWNWQGGISVENTIIRNSPEYKKWRFDVFKRDGFSCRICGQLRGEIEAHHILPFSTHKDLIFDVDNGITYCRECHKQEHKKTKIKRKRRDDN